LKASKSGCLQFNSKQHADFNPAGGNKPVRALARTGVSGNALSGKQETALDKALLNEAEGLRTGRFDKLRTGLGGLV